MFLQLFYYLFELGLYLSGNFSQIRIVNRLHRGNRIDCSDFYLPRFGFLDNHIAILLITHDDFEL